MNRSRRLIFFCLFFVSGACGLIYEIVWSRLLVFVFGGTTFAITTVLACFMGGLALGSFLAGRFSHRLNRPARVYGLLEIGVGLYCLLIPLLLDLALPMYQALATVSGGSFFWLTAARVLVCALILIVPTALMGATLPLLSKAFVRRAGELGGAVARLYGINTIGAFVGCAGAGFLLLPAVGLSNSILLAALLNVSAGIVAVTLTGKRFPEQHPPEVGPAPDQPPVREATPVHAPSIRPGSLLWLYGLSGLAAMAYQVAWTRALILSMGASTYAFSAIVACFILGIALGSLLISPWIGRIRAPLGWAGLLEAIIGLSALLVAPLFGEMPGLVGRLSEATNATFEHILAIEILSVGGLLIVPTLCMGALLPLICAIYEASAARSDHPEPDGDSQARSPATGQTVGAVYAANTVGTIIGATVTGFVLIPWHLVGMQRTIITASTISILIGTVFVLREKPWRRLPVYAATGVVWVVGILLALISEPWSKTVMVSGPYLGRGANPGEVVFYREGIDTTVAVTRSQAHIYSLLVNGKADASTNTRDMRTQLLLGHLPLLLNPDATEVCVIGLGSGVTASAVLAHPVRIADVVEISSAVVAAAEYFSPANHEALRDPRLRLHRADGRNFLLVGDREYDVIVSEPSNPWISGIANLFTTQFFEIARSRLKPGGLHCQWFHAYSMKADDFAAVIKTMTAVFPYVQLWEASRNDYLIICSDAPIVIDVESTYLTFGRPRVSTTLSSILINDPIQLAHYYVADGRDLTPWTGAQESLVDDLPYLEFSAPRYLLRGEPAVIAKSLRTAGRPPLLAGSTDSLLNQEFLKTIGAAQRARESLIAASSGGPRRKRFESLLNAARCTPHDARILTAIDQQLKTMSRSASEQALVRIDDLYTRIAKAAPEIERIREGRPVRPDQQQWPLGRKITPISNPEFDVMIAEAKALMEARREAEAARKAAQIATRFPHNPTALHLAGVCALKAHGAEIATSYLLRAWVMRPGDPETSYYLAGVYCLRGDDDQALAFLETAISNGFDDRARIESSEMFERLRGDVRFQRLLADIRPAGK